ncbi:MAG: amylo-alpha-1,6-glucosidase [Tepidisphaeraceae bacterium]
MFPYRVETYGELNPHLEREWLLTNGIGGFASSSVVGCNRRRYHALLCAATKPPVGRVVTLSRVGEIIAPQSGGVIELSISQFGDIFHPRGERYLRSFELGETARWEYEADGTSVSKELLLPRDRNIAILRYTISPGAKSKVDFQVLPFVAMRDFHALRRRDGAPLEARTDSRGLVVRQGELALHMRCDRGSFVEKPDWWTGHTYAIELERGQDGVEDLFNPGRFTVSASEQTTLTIWTSLEPVESVNWDEELKRIRSAATKPPASGANIASLCRAADDFVVTRKAPGGAAASSVIAGYPWFADWGRDTMVSLPGLFLTTRRFDEAARVLSLYAQYVSEGMIPNVFDDYSGEPHYNTVDASWWFIHAAFEFLRASKDQATFNAKLRPACVAIVDGYRRGTRFGIRMDTDGLITQGDATTQLTWMDAKSRDVCFTPRQGKPVEINALWYNALVNLGQDDVAAKVKESFSRTFWISPFRGLYDVVDGEKTDASVRPNQIFAASLPHSPLNHSQRSAVVEVVRRELLTPFGLRTLAASDPRFQSRYTGDQFDRDRAYHNGTIWPWLIGAFLEAYLRVHDRSDASIEQARQWLAPLIEFLHDGGCIGQLPEIFEAEPPHRPVGCFAQAWSVAEVLRLAVELGIQ